MKKTLLLSLTFIFLATTQAPAQNSTTRVYVTYDSETITVAGTAIGFTSAKITPAAAYRAELATLTLECAVSPCSVRILTTGTAPTASVGLKLAEGDSAKIYGYDDILNFKAIRVTANSGTVNVQYSR